MKQILYFLQERKVGIVRNFIKQNHKSLQQKCSLASFYKEVRLTT